MTLLFSGNESGLLSFKSEEDNIDPARFKFQLKGTGFN
jgi:hypothetical protein